MSDAHKDPGALPLSAGSAAETAASPSLLSLSSMFLGMLRVVYVRSRPLLRPGLTRPSSIFSLCCEEA
jgi:hypothetical protein